MRIRPRWVVSVFGFVGLAAGACVSFSSTPSTPDAEADGGPGAGDAPTGRDAPSGGDAAIDPCGVFDVGPKMAQVTASGTSFCVDTVEVSFDQYRAFRLAPDSGRPGPPPLDAGSAQDPCRSFLIDSAETRSAYPATVGFCAARAYCAWAGKRLCSAVHKPANDIDTLGEWYLACSPSGTNYPWGDNASDAGGRCPAKEQGDAARPVGSSPECRAPDAGIYDMIGNAAEWVGAAGDVDDRDGSSQTFAGAVRGRSQDGGPDNCTYAGHRVGQRIGGSADQFGFRCCADARR